MQNDAVSEQYFLYGQTDIFQMPVNFQEVIDIFGKILLFENQGKIRPLSLKIDF